MFQLGSIESPSGRGPAKPPVPPCADRNAGAAVDRIACATPGRWGHADRKESYRAADERGSTGRGTAANPRQNSIDRGA
jgi:hypothetical protein